MANSVDLDQNALYEYFHLNLHYLQRHLVGTHEKKFLPTEVVCTGANKHFLKMALDIIIFHAPLFVKSTDPTNIF